MKDRERIVQLVGSVCEMNKDFIQNIFKHHRDIADLLNSEESDKEKTRQLFKKFMAFFSYTGISDEIADAYREEHGDVTYLQITKRINKYKEENGRLCARLNSFDSFKQCGYKKGAKTCNNPIMFTRCPVPSHDLRNSGLNQKAYSFYLFLRDECQGDLISYIDNIIDPHLDSSGEQSCFEGARDAKDELVSKFKTIHGVGSKLANMTLAEPLMLHRNKPKWAIVGQSMIAIDSLVHNFLHRTGILKAFNSEHRYGGKECTEKCGSVLFEISKEIDASAFNKKNPKCFPRFVQHAIWCYCAEGVHNVCNGNNIDDSQACGLGDDCTVSDLCEKIPLR